MLQKSHKEFMTFVDQRTTVQRVGTKSWETIFQNSDPSRPTSILDEFWQAYEEAPSNPDLERFVIYEFAPWLLGPDDVADWVYPTSKNGGLGKPNAPDSVRVGGSGLGLPEDNDVFCVPKSRAAELYKGPKCYRKNVTAVNTQNWKVCSGVAVTLYLQEKTTKNGQWKLRTTLTLNYGDPPRKYDPLYSSVCSKENPTVCSEKSWWRLVAIAWPTEGSKGTNFSAPPFTYGDGEC